MFKIEFYVYHDQDFVYHLSKRFSKIDNEDFDDSYAYTSNASSFKEIFSEVNQIIIDFINSIQSSKEYVVKTVKQEVNDVLTCYTDQDILEFDTTDHIKEVYLNWDAGNQYGSISIIKLEGEEDGTK